MMDTELEIKDCVSDKIAKLVGEEGYDQDQATAIAYSMCGEGKSQEEAIAAYNDNRQKSDEPMYFIGGALKALGDGQIEGYLVVWGSPSQKDSYGEYFTPNTEFKLEYAQKLPIYYHHGLTNEFAKTQVGEITSITKDDTGLLARGHLFIQDTTARVATLARKVYDWVQQKRLGWSSGSAPHLTDVADNGEIKFWQLVEGTLTPKPAEKHRTTVQAIRSALDTLAQEETTEEQNANREPPVESVSHQRALIKSRQRKQQSGVFKMDTTVMIAALEKAGLSADQILVALKELGGADAAEETAEGDTGMMADNSDAAPPPEDPTMTGKSAAADKQPDAASPVGNSLNPAGALELYKQGIKDGQAALKKTAPATRVPAGMSRPNPTAPAHDIQVLSKWRDLNAEDMSYLANLLTMAVKTGAPTRVNLDGAFYREMLDKAQKAVSSGKLELGVEASNRLLAIKSNELDNTSVAAAAGNWNPELWYSSLWPRVRVDNNIASQFRTIEMPSDTFDLPIESTDPTVYKVPEATNAAQLTLADENATLIPSSLLSAGKTQLVAKKMALRVGFSTEMEEDSIIQFIPQAREQAVRTMQNAVDNVLINGDAATGATTNINFIDGTPAATAKYLVFNGLRLLPLVTNPAMTLPSGGLVTLQQIRQLRFKLLSSTNVYANRPQDLVIFVDVPTYGKLLNIDELLVYMNNGRGSTVNDGSVPAIDGTPVYASAEMGLTLSTGKANGTTTASNVYGNLVIAAKPAWYLGYRRQITQALEYLSYYDSYQMTLTVRLAFINKDTVASGILTGITV